MEDVWQYPRPPIWQEVGRPLCIVFAGITILQTKRARRVLETSHPPVYYSPAEDFRPDALVAVAGSSFCEFKGLASYWDVQAAGRRASRAAWSYPRPSAPFVALTGYVAVYAGPMDECWVGDALAVAQPGGFYGGWVTKDLIGPFKGGPGSAGW